jgi:hypothetical protein
MIDVIYHKLRLLGHWFLREKHFRILAAKSNWRSGGQRSDSRCNITASAVTMKIPENEDFLCSDDCSGDNYRNDKCCSNN